MLFFVNQNICQFPFLWEREWGWELKKIFVLVTKPYLPPAHSRKHGFLSMFDAQEGGYDLGWGKFSSFTRVGRGGIFLFRGPWVSGRGPPGSRGGPWEPYDVTLRRPATRPLLTLAWLFLQPEGVGEGGDAGVGGLMWPFARLPASSTCLWQTFILASKVSK